MLSEAPYSAVRIKEKLDEIGNTCGYTIIKDYVRSKKKELNNNATVRFETVPGLQAQVDWEFFENYRVTENVLSLYYQGKQIALHQISYNKYTMSVNREHYRNLVKNNPLIPKTPCLHLNPITQKITR